MRQDHVSFQIVELYATVPEGLPLEWRGRELASGPLLLELDETSPGESGNRGALDYSSRKAKVDFHVSLGFPELADLMEDLEADPSLAAPVRAILRSEGKILDDHSFALSGQCELRPHAVFSPADTKAFVLEGG